MDIAVQELHTCLGPLRAVCSTNDPVEAFRNGADLGVATGHDPVEKSMETISISSRTKVSGLHRPSRVRTVHGTKEGCNEETSPWG